MTDYLMNRLANSSNRWQGKYKRVLCICSAGLLRSPTAAFVLSQEPYNYNTRAAGLTKEFALIPVDEVLLNWAQEVVCIGPGTGGDPTRNVGRSENSGCRSEHPRQLRLPRS